MNFADLFLLDSLSDFFVHQKSMIAVARYYLRFQIYFLSAATCF